MPHFLESKTIPYISFTPKNVLGLISRAWLYLLLFLKGSNENMYFHSGNCYWKLFYYDGIKMV